MLMTAQDLRIEEGKDYLHMGKLVTVVSITRVHLTRNWITVRDKDDTRHPYYVAASSLVCTNCKQFMEDCTCSKKIGTL